MSAAAKAVEGELDRLIVLREGPEARLIEAMRYAVLGGGKRLRPFLAIESAGLFDVAPDSALRVAAAIEMIHSYSLVHDDLPAMDDDAMRRGRPTAHIAFDEATAILAGDGLLTLAFEVLSAQETHSDGAVRSALVHELAVAAGMAGMVGGQMIDLEAEHAEVDLDAITRLQRLKTGALISFACQSGAILARAREEDRHALQFYAHDLGLAFQIADDLLDVEGDATEVGKGVNKDAERGKATFVSMLGVEEARQHARRLSDQAVEHLGRFGDSADALRAVAAFVVERRN
ncbi:MAG: farnesyl-diphosphate synthase [Rhodospirillaceae bacterium]|nr:farnesyl-diphosphate synthase [Rhodospirillaceae bacterium]